MSESRDPAGDSTTTNNMGEVREAEHQGAAVKAALGANIGVAIAKLLAAFFTGSSAMLSESVLRRWILLDVRGREEAYCDRRRPYAT